MSETIVPIRRALISVFDKRGLIELARALAASGTQLLASGGTPVGARRLPVSMSPKSPTTPASPKFSAAASRPCTPRSTAESSRAATNPTTWPRSSGTVSCRSTSSSSICIRSRPPSREPDATWAEAIENIDIGGPALIRAAAKNHAHVAVLTSPEQYASVIAAVADQGGTSLRDRRRLALAAFRATGLYDQAIADYLDRVDGLACPRMRTHFPNGSTCASRLRQPLRYGENPHQKAAFYVEPAAAGTNLATAKLRHGKELSYNNLLDLDSALRLVRQFAEPAACILKHNNPCGAAVAADPASAFERAYEGDPVSAFGGIVGLNRPVDRATAEQMCRPGRFLEAILAPGFDDDALEWLRTKPSWRNSVRLLDLEAPIGPTRPAPAGLDFRRIEGGLLVQTLGPARARAGRGQRRDPTRRPPRPSGATSPSRGVFVPRSNPTRSSWRKTARSSVSARAR